MRRKPRDVSRRAEKNARVLPRRIGRRHRESRVVFGTVAGGDARISRTRRRRTGVRVSRHRYAASRAPDTRAAAVFRDGKSGGHARRARFRAKERGCVTHSMNGAVETRSNWKGLNAGLREVPSMAAMSFAVVGEGEDARNTRERALKSDGDERHPLRFGCPRNVAVSETIYLRGETWKAPQKLARKRKTDCVCAQTHRAPGVPYPFLSRIRIRN